MLSELKLLLEMAKLTLLVILQDTKTRPLEHESLIKGLKLSAVKNPGFEYLDYLDIPSEYYIYEMLFFSVFFCKMTLAFAYLFLVLQEYINKITA